MVISVSGENQKQKNVFYKSLKNTCPSYAEIKFWIVLPDMRLYLVQQKLTNSFTAYKSTCCDVPLVHRVYKMRHFLWCYAVSLMYAPSKGWTDVGVSATASEAGFIDPEHVKFCTLDLMFHHTCKSVHTVRERTIFNVT